MGGCYSWCHSSWVHWEFVNSIYFCEGDCWPQQQSSTTCKVLLLCCFDNCLVCNIQLAYLLSNCLVLKSRFLFINNLLYLIVSVCHNQDVFVKCVLHFGDTNAPTKGTVHRSNHNLLIGKHSLRSHKMLMFLFQHWCDLWRYFVFSWQKCFKPYSTVWVDMKIYFLWGFKWL